MKYRVIIKEVDDWWIGWLVDLPGVDAQEKTVKLSCLLLSFYTLGGL
jgi:hypothetical protein